MPKVPGKKSKDKDAENSNSTRVALRAADGALRELGEKALYLETNKHKILRFRLLAKTQFHDKQGEEVRDSLLKPGDQLSVEVSPDDPETALRVILIHKGSEEEHTAAARPFDHDSARAPEEADTHSAGSMKAEAEPAQPSSGDTQGANAGKTAPPDDKTRPTLARAGTDQEPAVAESGAPEKAQPVPRVPTTDDEIISAARDAADRLTQGLPDFIVQQNTTRYFSRSTPAQWQALDVVTADVASVGGKEQYHNIRRNGRPTNEPIEKTGAWSTGEFQTTLASLLNPYTAAAFHKTGGGTLEGRATYTYDFHVRQQNSDWDIHAPDGQVATPAYSGTIWIDRATFNVMRIEEQTDSLPGSFPFDKAESVVEYGFVDIAGKNYPLPTHSEILTCQRGSTTCTKNEIRFQNYRKYGADSTITFDK